MNLPGSCVSQTFENVHVNGNVKEKETDEKIFNRVDLVIIYIRYKINQIKNGLANVTVNNILWCLRQVCTIKPLKIVFHYIHGFFCKIKLITYGNELKDDVSNYKPELKFSLYSNSFTNDCNQILIENLHSPVNIILKESKYKGTEKIRKKKRTKYSEELLRELYKDTDDYLLSNDSDDQLYFRTTRHDISSTFSEQAMCKIKEMEEEIRRLKRQMEIVCQLKTLQTENEENLLDGKFDSSSNDECFSFSEMFNDKNSLNSIQNMWPPMPPPLPSTSSISSSNDSTSVKTTSKSCEISSLKSSRLDNNTLLQELQNIKLKHVEPVGKKKNFGSFLEKALHEKFKNVKLEDYSDSEYSLSDWSD